MLRHSTRRDFSATWASARRRLPFVLQPAQPRLRQPAAAQAAAGHHVQPQRRRAERVLARRGRRRTFTLKESLKPLEPFKNRTLILHGVCDRSAATATPTCAASAACSPASSCSPATSRAARDTPAGWASGISIDQEIKNHLQSRPGDAHALRLAGVRRHGARPGRHLDAHGLRRRQQADRADRRSLPDVRQALRPAQGPGDARAASSTTCKDDLQQGRRGRQRRGPPAARRARDVRARDGAGAARPSRTRRRPRGARSWSRACKTENDNIPRISKMQIDLMVNSFAADFARVATLQYTNSVGGAQMRWLGIDEGHHELSHEPDSDAKAQDKLTQDQQVVLRAAGLPGQAAGRDAGAGRPGQPARQHADRLDQRAGQGQLAHARQHPVRAGRQRPRLPDGPLAQATTRVPHNRLLLALAHGLGHRIDRFGNPNFCGDGPLPNLT